MSYIDESNEQIINLLMSGRNLKEVAVQLNMSPRTLEGRLAAMRKKVGCKTTTQLVVKIVLTRLIEDGIVKSLGFSRDKPIDLAPNKT